MKANGFQWLKRLGETQIGKFTINGTGYDTRTHQWFLVWLHEPLDKMQWELTTPLMKPSSDFWISCQLPLWCVVFLLCFLLTTLKDNLTWNYSYFSVIFFPTLNLMWLGLQWGNVNLCSPWILNIPAGPYSTFTWMCRIVTMPWVSTQLIRSTHLISDYTHVTLNWLF